MDALSCELAFTQRQVMRIRRYIGLCAAVLAASMSASYAGPCSDEIGAMQAKIDAKLEAKAAAGPPATAGAMEGPNSPQPTPRSIAGVEERMGEIRPETVQAIQQGMARARGLSVRWQIPVAEQLPPRVRVWPAPTTARTRIP